jgi:hypothetical protein
MFVRTYLYILAEIFLQAVEEFCVFVCDLKIFEKFSDFFFREYLKIFEEYDNC